MGGFNFSSPFSGAPMPNPSQMFNFSSTSGGGSGTGAGPGFSSNQFFPVLPPSSSFNASGGNEVGALPGRTAPGAGGGRAGVGPAPGGGGLGVPSAPPVPTGAQPKPAGTNIWAGLANWGNGSQGQGPLDPGLTSQFLNFLQNQTGKGLTPFNLPTALPWGGTTQPGQLNAPLDPVMQELLSGFTGGAGGFGGLPGMGTLQNVAQNGISAVPTWNTMVDAMQRQIGEGAANLKEQFNVGSGVVGTPYGTAATDYQLQSNKDLNSLLANMQFQGIGEQLGAANTLGQMGQQFGTELQAMGQGDIQNIMQEFMRTQPQYNPLLPYEMGASTTFQPVIGKAGSGGGILGGLTGLIPAGIAGIGAGAGAASGGAGTLASILAGLAAI